MSARPADLPNGAPPTAPRLLQATLVTEFARSDRSKGQGEQPPIAPEAPLGARLLQDLGRQVEGALARIQFNQIVSLPQDDPNRQVWQVDLPVRYGERLDNFQLQVEEEHPRGEHVGGMAAWSVRLSFDLAPLGPVHARIGLTGETISSTFWAEQPQTAALIKRRLDDLRGGLERVGLDVGRLDALPGRPPAGPPGPALPPLLDEQA